MILCFTGDAIMLTPPTEKYWQDNDLINLLRTCDLRCGNLEMVLSGERAFASTFCGGQWLTTNQEILEHLLRYGFDYFNTANNHTMDFSYDGLRLTNEALDSRNILHSGSGSSLNEATKPVYTVCEGRKIAFLSCTASCDDAARAGNSSKMIPARPGVNMLRHTVRIQVTNDQMKIIDEIAQKTCLNARFLKSVKMGTHSLPSEVHRLGRLEFIVGEEERKITYCHKGDLDRILKVIKDTKSNADIIVMSVHSHDIKGDSDDTADDYLEEFAHACIDVGVSIVIGTGTHQLKGIEIYKGKPIFYSLGNFIFKEEHIKYAPDDIFERYSVGNETSPEELFRIRTKNYKTGLVYDPYNYRSIIPIVDIGKNTTIRSLELVPIELGFENEESEKGFPVLAREDVSVEIYSRLSKLSKAYGTKMSESHNHFHSINVAL